LLEAIAIVVTEPAASTEAVVIAAFNRNLRRGNSIFSLFFYFYIFLPATAALTSMNSEGVIGVISIP
jgi:hypothetical protein